MITTSNEQPEDLTFDVTLRPQNFNDYVGQVKVKKNLDILIQAAKHRKESIEHVLLYGPAGLGKTTLANIIAKEMGVNIKTTSGPAIERVGDFGSILTNLSDGDILFIDEIHRLNKSIEEILYPAMEDYKLDIIIGKGPSARTIQLDLPKFTLIGATTKLGSISNPLRNRFGAIHRLEFYTNPEIKKILERSAKILGVTADETGLSKISECARCTPRVANRLLKRVRDFSQIKNHDIINSAVAIEALEMIDVDPLGLEPADKHILRVIIEKFGGGPVGLGTVAAATSEEIKTIEDVYEPYLIQIGFLARTPRGRIATESAYNHLGIKYTGEKKLF
ncbi:MAG: Holliday junction ATP-dependent DNA helicase RuvB [Candidatus Moranbacteria bacterium GW2011_GWF2_36_839]|nr:MAG: Holliday junction ATP-dependent DNA helicase RuvB [Candidatus Moranbacteria bacterium GW2011_GWF1_36_78]KKQ17062.1 MAG: Holliday junction ATP-dependent DNA helicase RuvB [Candidatus Moranbacteria bacterium GW2011_GWF2_36_839]HAT73664.1 Holliday junction branch migration DNA helicase RuvB [Candidatus Moranbacteria bacterium]HBY11359.1 Holliday junction branch migration DNA helicase RuvB [Candidatus Moranbacteria bacterium]